MSDSKFQQHEEPLQLELPFPTTEPSTNEGCQEKKKEGIMIYALTPPFCRAL